MILKGNNSVERFSSTLSKYISYQIRKQKYIQDEFKWLAYDMIHRKYSTASDCEQVKYDKLNLSLPLNELLLLIVSVFSRDLLLRQLI